MPLIAIHPGEHLAEELKTLDMSAAELARKISVPTNRVTQILNGTRSITGDTALRLGHWHQPAVLAESANPVRRTSRGTESGKSHSQPPKAEAQGARARLNGSGLRAP